MTKVSPDKKALPDKHVDEAVMFIVKPMGQEKQPAIDSIVSFGQTLVRTREKVTLFGIWNETKIGLLCVSFATRVPDVGTQYLPLYKPGKRILGAYTPGVWKPPLKCNKGDTLTSLFVIKLVM